MYLLPGELPALLKPEAPRPVRIVRRRSETISALVLAMMLTVLGQAGAGNIYVDPVAGNDANSGSDPSDALRTLRLGIALGTPGSTVVALPGIYSGTTNGEIFPLDVRAGVSLFAQDGPESTLILDDVSASEPLNTTLRLLMDGGTDFDGTTVEGFTIDGSDLPNNRAGIFISAQGTGSGVSPIIRGNRIRNYTGTASLPIDGSGILVEVDGSGPADSLVSALIEQNTITSNDEGISLYAFSQANQGRAIDTSVVRNNMIIDNAYGIVCLSSPKKASDQARGLAFVRSKIINNTCYRNELAGIQLVPFDAYDVNSISPLIANNIIEACDIYGIEELGGMADPEGISANNVFNCGFGLYFDYIEGALFTATQVNQLLESNQQDNLSIESGFVDPASPIPDLHLRADSTLIDYVLITDPWSPATDFENEARPFGSGYDTGADEVVIVVRELRRNTAVTSIFPTIPSTRRDYLPLTPADSYGSAISGDSDPDTGILVRTTSPLVFYQLVDAGPRLYLEKELTGETVRYWF